MFNREKKKQKNEFDLIESVHAPEYSTIQHQTPPEPAHRLEINLEASEFSEEKYDLDCSLVFYHSFPIRNRYITLSSPQVLIHPQVRVI